MSGDALIYFLPWHLCLCQCFANKVWLCSIWGGQSRLGSRRIPSSGPAIFAPPAAFPGSPPQCRCCSRVYSRQQQSDLIAETLQGLQRWTSQDSLLFVALTMALPGRILRLLHPPRLENLRGQFWLQVEQCKTMLHCSENEQTFTGASCLL